ncbi:MAG: D-tyrosyl-tRNA(Tyr) deacylase [Bacteroidia bacterium]|nr:D-tyrosyl-tRNA(Tyr) deacylase [Bacteroidia bacterium]MCZ2248683.1 D-tyrosyl-tRNA(Tyr) deacylase [Bacteroidia bacterium]
MRVVLQRVSKASVTVDKQIVGNIKQGILILLGIEQQDTTEDIQWLIGKIINLRIFDDENGVMNLSVQDIQGELLLISQFTLQASTKKGNRPSYIRAAPPQKAEYLYQLFSEMLHSCFKGKIAHGVFGADMKVELLNDGPVTIIIDSYLRE